MCGVIANPCCLYIFEGSSTVINLPASTYLAVVCHQIKTNCFFFWNMIMIYRNNDQQKWPTKIILPMNFKNDSIVQEGSRGNSEDCQSLLTYSLWPYENWYLTLVYRLFSIQTRLIENHHWGELIDCYM